MSETREQQARELVQWLTNPNPRFNALSYAEQEKRILERVARALAACALEERKVAQAHIDALEAMLAVYRLGDMRNGATKADKVKETRERWLEHGK